jgi:hypothetical protein
VLFLDWHSIVEESTLKLIRFNNRRRVERLILINRSIG